MKLKIYWKNTQPGYEGGETYTDEVYVSPGKPASLTVLMRDTLVIESVDEDEPLTEERMRAFGFEHVEGSAGRYVAGKLSYQREYTTSFFPGRFEIDGEHFPLNYVPNWMQPTTVGELLLLARKVGVKLKGVE